MEATIRDLAARHGLDADSMLEAWAERAAVRQHIAGYRRPTAELFALGDVERMYQIGLHCPDTIQRWLAGGDRRKPIPRSP